MIEILLKDALTKYKSNVSILKKGYEQEKYRIEQINKSFLGNRITKEITSVDIARYRDQRINEINTKTKKPLSPSTVRLEMSLLSNFFDIARIEWGYCNDNPVKNVRKPKSAPGRDRRLTAREERKILRYCYAHTNPDLYSIVVLALETAMRQGEIINLQWENINLKTRVIHLLETKNGTKRDVPLSIKAREMFIRLGVKSKGPVFNYTSEGIKSTWRFMRMKLEIDDLHFHDLRHESVSKFFELGTLDMMEIAAISGHKSLSMLKRYTHLKAQRLVRKLEGNKHKGKQVVLDNLVPYPAQITEIDSNVIVRLLDFENLECISNNKKNAIQMAQDTLLRHILISMRDAKKLPYPDQYLETIEENQVIMIDPLACAVM